MSALRTLAVLALLPTVAAAEPLPPGAMLRLGTFRLRIPINLSQFAVSADGKTVVAAGKGDLRAWDVKSGRILFTFPNVSVHRISPGQSLAISADGSEVAAGDLLGTIRRFEVRTGTELKPITLPLIKRRCESLSYSPDGRRLLAGYDNNDPGSSLVIDWDVTGDVRNSRIAPRAGPWCRYGPDGRVWLAAPGRLWGVQPLDCFDRFGDNGSRTRLVPDGQPKFIVLAGDGKSIGTLGDNHAGFHAVTGDRNGFTRTGSRTEPDSSHVWGLSLSPTGELAAATFRNQLQLWSVKDNRVHWTVPCSDLSDTNAGSDVLVGTAFAADGRMVVTGHMDGWVRRWNVANGRELIASDRDLLVMCAARSADGRHIAVGASDGRVSLWDAATGACVRDWPAAAEPLDRVAILRGGLLTRSESGEIRLWDAATGRPLRTLTAASTDRFRRGPDVVVSSDGSRYAVERVQGRTTLYDGATHQPLGEHGWRNLCTAVLSPNGQHAAIPMFDDTATVWDAVGRQQRVTLQFDAERRLSGLAFSPDGRWLATGHEDGAVRVWDATSGKRRGECAFDTAPRSLAYSPDGLWLAVGHIDGTLSLLDADAVTRVRRYNGHQDAVTQVMFGRVNRTVLTVSRDRTALLWSLSAELPHPLSTPTALWADLATDSVRAYRAYWGLVEQPACVALLARELRAAQAAFADPRIPQWLADLGDQRFAVRDAASGALAKLGPGLESVLRRERAAAASAEQRQRLDRLLAACADRPPALLRQLRAVSVLAEIDTPAAREVLKHLAAGPDVSPVTDAARAAVRRPE